jgi:hypothetical protein
MGLSTGCGYVENVITTTVWTYNMNVLTLLEFLKHCPPDNCVVINLKQPSVGGRACVGIEMVERNGIDWDSGKTTLVAEKPVVTEENLERIQKYARAYEKLLYLYAMENNLSFMGQPLAGSKMCPKGGAVRAFKEYMNRDAEEYLGNV